MYPAEIRYDMLFLCDPEDEATRELIGLSFEQIITLEAENQMMGVRPPRIGDR